MNRNNIWNRINERNNLRRNSQDWSFHSHLKSWFNEKSDAAQTTWLNLKNLVGLDKVIRAGGNFLVPNYYPSEVHFLQRGNPHNVVHFKTDHSVNEQYSGFQENRKASFGTIGELPSWHHARSSAERRIFLFTDLWRDITNKDISRKLFRTILKQAYLVTNEEEVIVLGFESIKKIAEDEKNDSFNENLVFYPMEEKLLGGNDPTVMYRNAEIIRDRLSRKQRIIQQVDMRIFTDYVSDTEKSNRENETIKDIAITGMTVDDKGLVTLRVHDSEFGSIDVSLEYLSHAIPEKSNSWVMGEKVKQENAFSTIKKEEINRQDTRILVNVQANDRVNLGQSFFLDLEKQNWEIFLKQQASGPCIPLGLENTLQMTKGIGIPNSLRSTLVDMALLEENMSFVDAKAVLDGANDYPITLEIPPQKLNSIANHVVRRQDGIVFESDTHLLVQSNFRIFSEALTNGTPLEVSLNRGRLEGKEFRFQNSHHVVSVIGLRVDKDGHGYVKYIDPKIGVIENEPIEAFCYAIGNNKNTTAVIKEK